jgi:hypothetical protein
MAESNTPKSPPADADAAAASTVVVAAGQATGAVAPHTHVNLARGRLSLIKGEHRWRFRWEPGSEATIISAVADLARDPRMNFDWFDAAVVCRHIAQGLPPRSAAGATSAPAPDSTHEK